MYIFLGGLECVGHSFSCRPFCIFEICLTLNPEGCRSNQCPVFLTNLEGKVGKVGKVGKEGRLRE